MHDLSIMDWILGGVVAVFGVFVLGAISNFVLKDNGFGTIVNGLLLVAGVGTGIFARALTLGFQ